MTDELKAWSEEQAYKRAKAEYMEKLDGIKTEIIDLANAYDYQQAFNHGLMRAVQIVDKYRNKEQKDNGFFDEIMDDESEDEETYEKIKEIINEVKEQEE